MKAFLTLFIFLTSITSYSQIAAIWSSPTSGTIDGVPFTITGLSDESLATYDFSTSSYSAGPLSANQQCLDYDGYNTVTISLESPIELYVYPKYWRTDTYLFSDSVVLLSGSNFTLTDNYTADAVSYADGIFKVGSPVSTFTITSTNQGCCSNQALTLAGINCIPTSSIDVITGCDSYTWIDGNTYTASTNDPYVPTLHTINAGNFYYYPNTLTINAGDTVKWINVGGYHNVNFDISTISGNSFNNPISFITQPTTLTDLAMNIFDVPGTYNYDCSVGQHAVNGMIGTLIVLPPPPTYTTTNAAGCDSVVTLDLTINNSSSSTDVITACDSYTWIDGNTYTSSNNTTTYTTTNVVGCDSVVTLDLTIISSSQSTISAEGLDSYTAPSGTVYTTGGVYTDTISNAAGCDSIITINLSLNYTGISELNNTPKQLIKIVDVLGRETPFKPNTPLLYIYNDGTVERKMTIKK